MASTQVLLLQLLLFSLPSESAYMGATAAFSYKGRHPNGTIALEFRYRDTIYDCQYSIDWKCYRSNCDTVQHRTGVIDRSTNTLPGVPEWCETENVLTKHLPDDKPFNMGVPQNCSRSYRLMAFDPDGDTVRCRYGNTEDSECSICNQHSGFLLDEESCTLNYRFADAGPKVYGFELMVEDFPRYNITLAYSDGSFSSKSPLTVGRNRRAPNPNPWTTMSPPTTFSRRKQNTTNAPTIPITPLHNAKGPLHISDSLSKLPLQFSVLVDPPAPSCQEGEYLPMFVNPTPQHGDHIHAEVNKEVEIRVKARATYSTLDDIIMSGPLGISKHRITHDQFVIRWTPAPEDLGEHYAVCFAVESLTESRIYQSEMRCVVVDVKKEQVKSNVICGESTMTVEIEKSSLSGLHEDNLQLSDPTNAACSLERHSNSTHVIAVIPLNACGTQLEEDDDNLIFKNEIIMVDDHSDLITRKHLLEVEFYCQYPKRGNVALGFTAHRTNVTVWEKGFGTFTYQFEFFEANNFQTMMDQNSYPLEYDIGSRIYMEMEASSSVNNTELFVESCWAAPYDNSNYQPTYPIIENGCEVDETVEIYSPDHQTQFKFSMEAFKFIGLHDQVYISCSVMMCEAGNPNTRCSQGCINSTRSGDHHHHHRKREAVIQSANHFISQGPLRLRRSAEGTDQTNLNLNLNLVFIAGCLLAAVGMISAAVMYKAKMSKDKYEPLPAFES
ncbi:CUB and zona pellucida-like domain-containing protein 1 [Scomber japonicus]|uniref:CUB and zona pellucida-like domain-containing protein 1 n=1 Tax=Scomber japonicus TaxID=13676 RepID=UPI002305C6D6|nr:CUB and zona pellucida-like domain-containing protein 1 [Scomber japonicus]